MKESHVLAAMGVPPHEAQCAIRVSMGWKTEDCEVSAFIQAWKDIYSQHMLKEVS
jgi:cysteine desulfurase